MKFPELNDRRAKLRALKLCINGPLPGARQTRRASGVVHGPVVKAGKCQHCIDVHKKTDLSSARLWRSHRRIIRGSR